MCTYFGGTCSPTSTTNHQETEARSVPQASLSSVRIQVHVHQEVTSKMYLEIERLLDHMEERQF
jgi:hypothetical protein